MDEVLRREIEALKKVKTKELKGRYRELFGESSPSSNHAHLFRRVAWRLQVRAEGDLSERARQRAAQLADDADLRLRAPHQFWQHLQQQAEARDEPTLKRDARLPPAGSVLKRVYRGQTVEVKVLDDSFEYHGRAYTSLSAIASRVTGTRWNGFGFFGLLKQGQA
jgi:Protein of unknown function (DUF2924)